ncbi:MAG TPA: hypothetical protein VHK47_00195 [Polyangia bacterium]|nr:hypothetical protein [Polyangia bacterium]
MNGELSPETEEVLRRARSGDERMPAPRRRRLKGTLLARIAVGGAATLAAGQGAASTLPTLGVGFVAKAVVGIALIGTIGAGSYFALRPARHQPARHAAAVVQAPPPVVEPVETPEPPVVETHTRRKVAKPRPVPARSAAVAPSPPPPVDGAAALAAETALLREADRALRAGDNATALALLDEHATRFPHGVLEPERTAERLIVLCELGVADARDVSQFLSTHAGSPLAARVRRACPTK